MDHDGPTHSHGVATIERPFELELADGSRLVPEAEAKPARVEGDSNHAFTLADVQRQGGEPFAGYRRVA
jgi:hypothetical protein